MNRGSDPGSQERGSAGTRGVAKASLVRIRFVPDVLIHGDTVRSPELRHEVPVMIPDAFLYAEKDGRRTVVLHALEIPRVREEAPELEIIPLE